MKKLLSIIKYIALYFISLELITFAVSKLLNQQFVIRNIDYFIPIKDLPRFTHAWSFFGRSYAYNAMIGYAELLAGILILFNRTRLVGLLLSLVMFVNIVVIDVAFEIFPFSSFGDYHAFIALLLNVLLLIPFAKDMFKFFWQMQGRFKSSNSQTSFWLDTVLPVVFILVAIGGTYQLITTLVAQDNKLNGAYQIQNFSLNQDAVALHHGKYTSQPMLFFEMNNVLVLSANDSNYWGNYQSEGDSIWIEFYKPFMGFTHLNAKWISSEQILIGATHSNQPFRLSILPFAIRAKE